MPKKIKDFILANPIIVLFLISLCTRLIWLFWGISSVTNDEADIYTSAYILGRTFKDYYGNFAFLTSGILTAKPSLPIYIGAIPWLFTPVKSLLLARLPFVLLNSITPLLFYSLVKALTNNKKIPVISFFILNFSPWFSYPSVTGYEAMVALFFILLFFRTSVSHIKQKIKITLVVFSALCAFNSYMGMKPVFPFILLTGMLFYFNAHKTGLSKKSALKSALLSAVIFAVFIAINYVAPNSTLVRNEYRIMLNYYEKPKIEGMVWFERWTSSGPDVLVSLLSNKYTIRVRDYLSKYFLSFNPQIFFQKGDPSALYGTADLSGLFFVTDFIFLLWGLYRLSHLKEKGLRFILLLFFFGPLPIVLSNTAPTFILRGIVLIIPYTLVVAYGMTRFAEKWKKGFILLAILFAVNYALYLTVFRVRIMNLNGEQWRYSIRIISDRIYEVKDRYKRVTLYNPEAQETFFQYAFYHINDPNVIADRMRNRRYTYGNLSITDGCPKTPPRRDELQVYNKENCGLPPVGTKTLFAIEPTDRSGKDYFIFSGK